MHHPFSFAWHNLTLRINNKHVLFSNESGKFHSNSLVAIIGPSGVGKTTFLASLAGKNSEMTGSLLVNNQVVSPEYVRNVSGYLFQDDIYVKSLTVFEHFKFMNALKSNKDQEIINKIINELSLEKSKNTQIKNISSGEKKRLALGTEFLNDPFILFCDEPTTGLDSYSAIKIIEKLASNALNGKLIFATIHQPSSQIFEYFTHVVLISKNKVFYQGERARMKEYFENLNLICPPNYNPSDFYLKCTSTQNEDVTITHHNNELFKNITEIQKNTKLVNFRKPSVNNLFREVYWLLWRNKIETKRNLPYHISQFLLLMVTATILATVYSFVSSNNEHFVQNVKGILFFFTSELIFTHTYSVVNTFPEEYHIIIRERELYSSIAYFLSKVLATIPKNAIQSITFLGINFILVDFLTDFWVFMQMFMVLFGACISATILGLCISAVFTSLEYMDLFTAPFELITMLAAGILIKLPSLKYLNGIKYLSPFYYTYESLSIIYWSDIDEIGYENSSFICYKSGKEVLQDLGFSTESTYCFQNIFHVGLLSIFIGLIGYLTICYKRNKNVFV